MPAPLLPAAAAAADAPIVVRTPQEAARVLGAYRAEVVRLTEVATKLRHSAHKVKEQAKEATERPALAAFEGFGGGVILAYLKDRIGPNWHNIPTDVLAGLAGVVASALLIGAGEEEYAEHLLFVTAGVSGAAGADMAEAWIAASKQPKS